VRIAYLGSGRSIHTLRWVSAVAARGHAVHLVTQDPLREPLPEAASVEILPRSGQLGYFLNVWALRRIVRRLRPDLLHVNYAAGYGTLARLAALPTPLLLSVWGSDVEEVPGRSRWHRALIIGNLRSAGLITSTSHDMANTVRGLLPAAPIAVVPFGIDTARFRPVTRDAATGTSAVLIGTVKGLDRVYGIDILLRAFALLPRQTADGTPVRLVVAGTNGPLETYRALARELGVEGAVTFLGDVPHGEVPELLSTFTVYAALSRRESFGVAVLEASACGVPVVVTRVGGLPEAVQDGVTGLIVGPENPAAAAAAIGSLLDDPSSARDYGLAGREFVRATYEWSASVDMMIDAYRRLLDASGRAEGSAGVAKGSRDIKFEG
jgi:glycosyltransferase involved in cell wall biosynthesis